MSCSPLALMAVTGNILSSHDAALMFGIVIIVVSVALDLLLLSRIKDFKADNTEENYHAVKKIHSASVFGRLLILIWIMIVSFFWKTGFLWVYGALEVCTVCSVGAVLFSIYCEKKYNDIKKIRSAEIMKQSKGNPSAVLSEDMGLSQEERDIVSQIALSAGVNPHNDHGYKSDEELFGDARDPNAPLEDNEDSKDNGENANSICPFCGKTNKSEYKICAYCGQLLPVPSEAAAD